MFAAARTSQKVAVAQAQTLMNLITGTQAVVVDGIVGEQTRAAYKGLQGQAQSMVDSLVSNRNGEALASLKLEHAVPSGSWTDLPTATNAIKQAVAKYGSVSDLQGSTEDYLLWLLELEPATKVVGGVRYYDAASKRGPYLGLFQIGPQAYEDVRKSGRATFPPLSVSGIDPILNAEMAVIYAQLLARYLRTTPQRDGAFYKGAITKEILYAAHNQGANGFLSGAANAMSGGQSSKAKSIILSALEQIKRRS